jgi:hypothetical protein
VKQFLRRIGVSVGKWFDFGATARGRTGRAEVTHKYPLKQARFESARKSAFRTIKS